MIRPEKAMELFKLVNPLDLLEVLDFSGRNDKIGSKHQELRREYSERVYNAIHRTFLGGNKKHNFWRDPNCFDLEDDLYDTIILCTQDYYWWSHKLHHDYASVYHRVINALQIEKELYECA